MDDFPTPGSHPSLVLLGRAEAVKDTAEWFELLNIPSARFEIDYFDVSSATEFITKYMSEKATHRPHERNPDEFARAKDLILSRLQQTVPDGVPRMSLAGYAPVLELVSELLDVANPFAEVQGIIREAEKWRIPKLIKQIAAKLLEREHGKTVIKLAQELKPTGGQAFSWARAYSPDEQCLRLLCASSKFTIENPPPEQLPAQLRDPYERRLKEWVEGHPFSSQPLFMEYVYAWLFTREGGLVALRQAVREYLRQPPKEGKPYRPTPLLARFVTEFRAGNGERSEIRVESIDFGFVYESVLAGAPVTQKPKLTLVSLGEHGDSFGEITVGVSGVDSEKGQRLAIRLWNKGKDLWFWRQLASADIQVAQEIKIGAPRVDFNLGPDIEIECDRITFESSAVRILAPTEDLAVIVSAAGYNGEAIELLGSHEGRVALHIDWTPLHHPWNRYASSESSGVRVGAELDNAFAKLRRILVRFRGAGYRELARHEDLIENNAVAGSGLARDLLTFCVDRRLIRRERPFYVLDRDEMDRLEIHWRDIRERRITQSVKRFLGEFLKQ